MTEQELTALAKRYQERWPVYHHGDMKALSEGYLALLAQCEALQAQVEQLQAGQGVVTVQTPQARCTCFNWRESTTAGCPLHGTSNMFGPFRG